MPKTLPFSGELGASTRTRAAGEWRTVRIAQFSYLRAAFRTAVETLPYGRDSFCSFYNFEGTEDQAKVFVYSLNVHRRHLEYDQRVALAVVRKQEIQAERPQGARTDLTSPENGRS